MNSRSGFRRATLNSAALSVLMLAAAGASQAWAAPADDADADTATGLTEVVVTAQKRETNLQRTPIAITVNSSEDLENRRVKSLADLGDGSIPSLRIAPFFTRNSAFTIGIRGIFPSSDANQPARDTATGVYIDGVYLGRPQGLGAALFDIERIEVLKGPQGTLFGRNSTGGALNIVTKKPSGEFQLRQTIGARNFEGYSTETHLDLPEVANVSVKLDFLATKRDGTVDNPANGELDYNSYDRRGFHARALWAPSDTFTADYQFDVSYDGNTPYYVQLVNIGEGGARLAPLALVQSDRAKVSDVGVPLQVSEGNIWGHSLALTWEPWADAEIKSITSYRKLKQTQFDNGTAHAVPFAPNGQFARYSLAASYQHQFSQEVQLAGKLPQLVYVVGAYFFRETGGDNAWAPNTLQWNATGSGFTRLPNFDAGAATRFPDRESYAVAESLAFFGQTTWTPPVLDDRLHLTVGARYTMDDKNGTLLKVNGAPDGSTFDFSSNRLDPAVSIAFDATETIHLYGKWGTAYRAGGANSRSLTFRSFGPEEVEQFELGVKSEFWDRRARLNLAAYRTNYTDIQVDFNRNAIIASGTRTVNETVNAPGTAKIQGYEADLTVNPIAGLTLTASYAYTKAELPATVNPFNNVVTPLNIVYTPRNSYSFSGNYVIPMDNFEILAHVDANISDGYNSGNSVVTSPQTDDSFIVNARLAITNLQISNGPTLEFSLWSRNILNESHLFFKSFNTATRWTSGIYNEPRTYGLDLTIRY
ncbi:TonB-dependent receptor [Phenylobacterium sp.]|jgi:iron complex outermembrane receptor protein|uniref:TonB-dependent receptor n=1 Tax=Phenylobacterium sp. TaxID=1871053 RepID=UPI0037C878D5